MLAFNTPGVNFHQPDGLELLLVQQPASRWHHWLCSRAHSGDWKPERPATTQDIAMIQNTQCYVQVILYF